MAHDLQHACFDLRRYPARLQQHTHAHHQIILPLGGVLTVEIGCKTLDVGNHTAAVVTSNRLHGFKGANGDAMLILDIPVDSVAAAGTPLDVWDAFSQSPFVMFDEGLSGLCGFIASHESALQRDLLRTDVLGGLVLETLGKAIGFGGRDVPARLRKARRFIDAHYLRPMTIADIARAASLSESRLYALFENWLGVSPARYVARCRLRHAATLLRGTSMSVLGVALAIGYGDQSSFTRAFQREFGQSPSAYRKSSPARRESPAQRERPVQ
jgi:AraC-like DNA-binding protein